MLCISAHETYKPLALMEQTFQWGEQQTNLQKKLESVSDLHIHKIETRTSE